MAIYVYGSKMSASIWQDAKKCSWCPIECSKETIIFISLSAIKQASKQANDHKSYKPPLNPSELTPYTTWTRILLLVTNSLWATIEGLLSWITTLSITAFESTIRISLCSFTGRNPRRIPDTSDPKERRLSSWYRNCASSRDSPSGRGEIPSMFSRLGALRVGVVT